MKRILLLLAFFISLISTAQVTAGPVPDYVICDDPSNDGVEIFDLSVWDALAIGNQDPATHTVSYFESQFDAVNNLNPLNNTFSNVTNPQLIFVRVDNTSIGNFNLTTSNLIVEALPVVNNPQTFTYCGTVTATGQIQVDLYDIEPIMANGQSNLLFTYFLSQQDADMNANPLSTTFIANANTPIDLFIRIQTSLNCFEVINVVAILTNCNQSSQVVDLEQCGDPNNLACFDLNQNTAPALGTNSPTTHQVTYHASQADADNNLNSLLVTYCTQNTQTIFVRVEEIATGNADTTQQFNVVVNESPQQYSFSPVLGCDLGIGFVEYDASTVVSEITNLPSPVTSFSVEYYESIADANNRVNLLGVDFNFAAPSNLVQVYARVEFLPSGCSSISPLQVFVDPSCIFIGQGQNLEDCPDTNGQACFDLTTNELAIIASNDPNIHVVTYHLTQADADLNVNAVANPSNYCVSQFTTIFARLSNTNTGGFAITSFSLSVSDALVSNTILNEVTGCDDDLDGTVVIDLTAGASQLSSTNTIEYYGTLQNAISGTSALQNPTNFNVVLQGFNPNNSVFLREVMPNGCDMVYELPVIAFSNCNNSYLCDNAQSLCDRISQPFPNIADGSTAEPGNYYPFSQANGPRNPSWFYIPIEASGVVELEVYQNTQPDFLGQGLDIDFVIYGPFTTPTGGCATGITQANYVDHSFSTAMPEIATIPNAQAGEYYLILTSNFSTQSGFLKFELGANSTATINCDGFRMNAILDTNLNGVVDATDVPFPLGTFNYDKNASGSVMQVASPTGSYSVFDTDPTAIYDLGYDVLPAYTTNYTVAPATINGVTIPTGSGVSDQNFLVTAVNAYEDVVVYIIPQEQPRPGFTYKETIVYANLGTAPVMSGQLTYTYDPLLTVVSVDDPLATVSPVSVDLNYTNLLPFEYRSMEVEMQIPVIPTVALGDLLTNTATITPVMNDITPNDNSSVSTQVIIGSYDPNDKMESRGPFINPAEFDANDYFYYRIRFENTGTASAINVRIEDTLDAQLDWTTIEMLDASHPYVMTRMEDQVIWNFDNIMLPDSTSDPVGANGHVYFRIKPNVFTEGTVIPNTAEIYFDFNPPIITNTFTSTFRTPLSVDTPQVIELSVSPNPSSGLITVGLSNTVLDNAELILYDLQGRITLSRKLTQNQSTVNISDLPVGIYLAELRQGDNSYTTKIIKE